MTPPFDPTLLRLGPFVVHWYGLLIVIGIILGANVGTHLAKVAGEDPDNVWDMLLVAVIFGIIGARIEYVVTAPHWQYYKDNLLDAFYIWQGGLRIYGAIVVGGLSVIVYTGLRNLNPLQYLDFCAPGMALGQSIGRWGNFINQELYGPPTTLPWGLDIPPANRIPPYNDLNAYPQTTRFHPVFLYESLANLLLFLGLYWAARRYPDRLKHGDLTVAYLIGYGLIRFGMDFLRTDGTSAQVLSLALVVIGAGVLVARHWPRSQSPSAS